MELDDDEDMADLSKKVFASEKRFEEGNVKDDFEVMTKIRGKWLYIALGT